jgi:SAM-dependent methyltransferase
VLLHWLHAALTGMDKSPAMKTGRRDVYRRQDGTAIWNVRTRRPESASVIDKLLAQYAWETSQRGSTKGRSAALYSAALAAIRQTLMAQSEAGADGCGAHGKWQSAAAMPLVVDVGAGLGIWLDVLAHHGITAVGIESNAKAVGYCRRKGHHIVVADPMACLAAMPAAAIAAATAFELDRHVDLARLAEFFEGVARVLVPGGALFVTITGQSTVPSQGFPLPKEFFRLADFILYLAREAGLEEKGPLAVGDAGEPKDLLAFWKRDK